MYLYLRWLSYNHAQPHNLYTDATLVLESRWLSTTLLSGCRAGGLGSRRSISLEARAAPLKQAQPAPHPAPHHTSTAINSSANGSSDGAGAGDEETELPVAPSAGGPADMMQSADDDLDPDTIRAKSHEEVSCCCCPCLADLKHLHNVETRSYSPRTFLSLGFQ